MVAHACNCCTREVGQLSRKFKTSSGYRVSPGRLGYRETLKILKHKTSNKQNQKFLKDF